MDIPPRQKTAGRHLIGREATGITVVVAGQRGACGRCWVLRAHVPILSGQDRTDASWWRT
jgi:hypothetical protein